MTIGERHYHGDEWDRMILLFQEKVVNKIEERIQEWEAPFDSMLPTDPSPTSTPSDLLL
ncbi:hypothetical protein GF373_06925 [bacterium]|nr:hypothetical protein [bacterium]